MATNRILLVSTHPLLSEGLQGVLGEMDDFSLVGPLALENFNLGSLAEYAPDVCCLPVRMMMIRRWARVCWRSCSMRRTCR